MAQHRDSKLNLLWLQSGGCGGCTLSLLGAESPDLLTTFDSAGIRLLWHPSLSEQSASGLHELLQQIINGDIRLDLFCLEGSVIQGPDGSGLFHRLSGSDRPMRDWIHDLSKVAHYSIAIGSCAAFGGITSGGGNPSEACGLQFENSVPGGLLGESFNAIEGLPVINIAGCPVHPNWVTESLLQIAHGDMNRQELDEFNRPRSYTDHLVHHACPRNEFYEFKASAAKPSDLGCLMENMGCLGTQAHADCNIRPWNGEGSCIRGGYACINCTQPGFQEPDYSFTTTQKIAGIPVGLPTDMPKAWFIALASLSKAATPKRLRENAHADHILVTPGNRDKDK